MTFRDSFFNVKNLLKKHLETYGFTNTTTTVDGQVVLKGWDSLLSLKQNTNLTISIPATTIVYSDEFLITGVLETVNHSKLAGKTIKLKVGNTIVDTTITTTGGVYEFTQTPVSMGNHTFQVIFEGDSLFNSSESTTLTKSVNKETSVINVSSSTIHHGDDCLITGSLVTDDNEVIANATVTINGNTVLTDSNGDFSFVIENNYHEYLDEITSTINPAINDLPSKYILEYEIIKKQNISGSAIRIKFGEGDKKLAMGFDGSATTNHAIAVANSSTAFDYEIIQSSELNTWVKVICVIDSINRTASLSALNETVTLTNIDSNVNMQYLYEIMAHNGASFRNVKIKPYPTLQLSSNKTIISADDDETCVLTAFYSKNRGYDIYLYKENTLVGKMQDNNDGSYSYTYTSNGDGDVTFYAQTGDIKSNNLIIEDCYLFNSCTTNSIEDHFTVPSIVKNGTYDIGSTGWKFGNASSYTNFYLTSPANITVPFEVELQINELNNNGFAIFIDSNNYIATDSSKNLYIQSNNSYQYITNPIMGEYYTLKVFADKLEWYKGDTLIISKQATISNASYALYTGTGANRYIRIKDFKIKAIT